MTDRGWICLHRKSIENPLFQKPLVWHYWQYCLLKANHTDKKIIWNKEEMIIEKGSFITGRKKAAQETGLTEQNIRTAIEILVKLGMVVKSTTKSTSKFTYLTICNYSEYQEENNRTNHQINQQLTTNQPATNHKQQLKELKELRTKDIKTRAFDTFWVLYPKKKSKGQARKTWNKIKPTQEMILKIMAVLALAKKSKDWLKDNGQYIPYPATWLNNEGWNDEETVQPEAQGASPTFKQIKYNTEGGRE